MTLMTRFLVNCIILHLMGWNPMTFTQAVNVAEVLLCPLCLEFDESRHNHPQTDESQNQCHLLCHWYITKTKAGPRQCPVVLQTKQVPIQTLTTIFCYLEHKNESNQSRVLLTVPYPNSLHFGKFMRRGIECLFKTQYKRVNLSTLVQDFSSIIYYQLSFTTVFLSWMHFAYPTRDCVFQGDPWCLNILCAHVTCRECNLLLWLTGFHSYAFPWKHVVS